MITQEQLEDLSAKLSALPCPVCGKPHSVSFRLHSAGMFSDPVVLYDFPDRDTCEGFRQKMTDFASGIIRSMNVGPCPFDRI